MRVNIVDLTVAITSDSHRWLRYDQAVDVLRSYSEVVSVFSN